MDGAQPPVKGETLTFGHTIKPGSFIGLSLKNGLLNIITLTLYRFWGKTEVRRRVWSHITLNDEPFEYTGRGKELFLGFLIALLVLGVPYLALILAIQFVSPMFTLLMLPLYIAIIVLIGVAIFMTYRYMASRTVWRGVRFNLRGSANRFGWSYLGYTLLVMITLGWYAPAMSMRIAEKLWGGMSYGDQKLRWERSHAEGLYGPFAIAWVAGVIGYFVLLATMVPALMSAMRSGTEPGVSLMLTVYGYSFAYALFILVASSVYHAALMRTIVSSIRLGDAQFGIDVKAGPLIGLTLTNLLITILTLGFLTPVVTARTAKFMISRLFSAGEAPLADALQAERGPKTGEGLADAFDVSPF